MKTASIPIDTSSTTTIQLSSSLSSTNGFIKSSSSSRNRSGSINIGRNRSSSDSDQTNNNNDNDNDNDNNSNNNDETSSISTTATSNTKNTNSSPTLLSKAYTNVVEYSKSEFNLMTKSLKYIDKNRYYSSIKCTILGVSGVGKTSFIRRFSSGEFLIEESTTFGAIRTLHMMHYSNLSLNLEIWDSGGHDRLRGLLPFYLTGTNCVIFMYDVGNRDSFRKTFDSLSKCKNLITEGSLILIVGNKADCKSREITTEELEKRCLETDGNISWCEISARTGYNIHEPFNIISKNITTMINILKSNHRNERLSNSNGSGIGNSGNGIGSNGGSDNKLNLPTFFELDEGNGNNHENHHDSLPSHIMTNPDMLMIRNNNYSCLERTNKAIPENVIVKLDPLKIVVEPSINTFVSKILSMNKKILFFKEANDNSDSGELNGGSGGSSGNGGSGEVKGSFCIIVDKYHPKRIEFKRRSSPVSCNSEVILLCDYRDHLIKTFISLCPPKFKMPIIEGSSSSTVNDFINHLNDCLKSYLKTPIDRLFIERCNRATLSTSKSQIVLNKNNNSSNSNNTNNNNNNNNEILINLNLSKMLKDEKYIISTSQSINWNASIEILIISNNNLDSYDLKIFGDLLQSINNSISIINLDISKNNLNYKHKNLLVEFVQSMKLKSLDLSFNELSSSCNLIAQSSTQNSTLTSLSLSNNKLTNDNAQSLSQMVQSNNVISNLDLSDNQIEDEGALFLLKVQQSKQQTNNNYQLNLNLQSNPIKHFSKFTSLPSSPTSNKQQQ